MLKYFWLPLLAFAAISALLYAFNAPLWVLSWYFRICCVALVIFGTWVMKGRITTKDKDRDIYQ